MLCSLEVEVVGCCPLEGVCSASARGALPHCLTGIFEEPGNPGVVRQDELPWSLGGVMSNGGLNNCQAGFPFWVTSTEFFIDWIKDVMSQDPAVN